MKNKKKMFAWIAVIIASIAPIFAGFFVYGKLIGNKKAKERAKDFDNELDQLEPDLSNLRVNDLRSAADSAEFAMTGMGTYNDQLMAALTTPKNTAEFRYFYAYFGIRDGADLKTWVLGDWGEDYISSINQYYGQMEIDFTF